MSQLQEFLARAKVEFDLADPGDQESLAQLAQELATSPVSNEELEGAARAEGAPIEFRLAVMLARSKRIMRGFTQPLEVAVVFAMWGEHNRLHPRSADNPHGEDSLRTKIAQLQQACEGTPIRWRLYAVDDGCPNGSGAIAAEISEGHPEGDQVHVLHLARALPATEGPLVALASADESRKGGAIILGCERALADGADAVIYTDADNSVHLGQIGLLLEPMVERGARVVLGNRKHPDAVLVKQEGRWGIGIKVLRHMQRMVGSAIYSRGIRDTQAAFKLYERTLLEEILGRAVVFDFSFDTEWISVCIALGVPFEQVPFAFIDSAAESASITQGPMTTWETLLKGLVRALRAHGVPHDEEMAQVLDEEIHSAADLDRLIDHLPPELVHATDTELGDRAIMEPSALREWIRARKL